MVPRLRSRSRLLTAALAATAVLGALQVGLAGLGDRVPLVASASAHESTGVKIVPVSDTRRGLVYSGLKAARTGPCAGSLEAGRSGVCTHGPDAAPPGVDIARSVPPAVRTSVRPGAGIAAVTAAAVATTAVGTTTATSPVVCEGDGQSGNRVQVLYVRGQGSQDRFAQYLPSFRSWAAGMDEIYNESAKETGGTRHVRFVTEAAGTGCQVSVLSVEVSAAAMADFGTMNQELASRGFNRRDRKYSIFADATVYCGIGGYIPDDRAGATNPNNVGPSYGRADSGCWNAATAAHELGHTLGAVSDNAPHSSKGGHCVDEWDVMCYSDTPYHPQMQYLCADRAHEDRLDCNHDDYFSTSPAPGSFLATHWNMADSVFLTAGPAGPTTSGPSATPTPAAPVVGRAYVLGNVLTGRVADVYGGSTLAGVPVVQQPKSGYLSQRWRLVQGADGAVSLRSELSGRCLQVYRASLAAGMYTVQSTCTGRPEQLWTLRRLTGGYAVIARHSGMALGISGWQIGGSRVLGQQAYAGTAGQTWTFSPVA